MFLASGLSVCTLLAACRSERLPKDSPEVSPARGVPVSPSPGAVASPGSGDHDFTALDRGASSRGKRVMVFRRPSDGSGSRYLTARNPMGQRVVFLITDSTVRADGTWYRILLPERPNGSERWVPSREVRVVGLQDRLVIDLSRYTLTRYSGGRMVDHFKVGIGQPQWPTPAGAFYVWAQVPQASPTGPYGAYALGLSGFSPVLTEWPGGGRFAIHGTPYRWDTGRKISHGCIRVFNRDVLTLRDIPLGTPVMIVP